jgi:hypothetical protein
MALVCFLDGARDVVPQSYRVVEAESQDEATVRAKADVGDRGVVFVY